jgi:hypothetical protein
MVKLRVASIFGKLPHTIGHLAANTEGSKHKDDVPGILPEVEESGGRIND